MITTTTYPAHVLSANALAILTPSAYNHQQIVRHHFKHRHDGRGSIAARNWIRAYRDWKRACGYDEHVRIVQAARSPAP